MMQIIFIRRLQPNEILSIFVAFEIISTHNLKKYVLAISFQSFMDLVSS